jgi:hypothetical protein
VRPLALWRYEVRRAGWAALLTPPVATGLTLLLVIAGTADSPSQANTARAMFALMEMAIPLAAGIGTASLIGPDPGVEWQLTLPTSYRATLLRRFGVTLGWAALVAAIFAAGLVTTGWWDRNPDNHGAFAGQMVWLAPTLWLGAAGLLAGALLRNPAAASGLIAGVWILEQVLADAVQTNQWSRLLYLFASTRGVEPADWTANRLTLLVTAVCLAGAAWLLLGRPERLLREGAQ